MNYTQSFEEFSSGLGPTDLALYAGIGIVLYILFKDKLSPVQKMLLDLVESFKSRPAPVPAQAPVVNGPVQSPSASNIYNKPDITKFLKPVVPPNNVNVVPAVEDKDEVFFELITSWKKTRDLAEQYSCEKALEMLDNVFQYLSPKQCDQVETSTNE